MRERAGGEEGRESLGAQLQAPPGGTPSSPSLPAHMGLWLSACLATVRDRGQMEPTERSQTKSLWSPGRVGTHPGSTLFSQHSPCLAQQLRVRVPRCQDLTVVSFPLPSKCPLKATLLRRSGFPKSHGKPVATLQTQILRALCSTTLPPEQSIGALGGLGPHGKSENSFSGRDLPPTNT